MSDFPVPVNVWRGLNEENYYQWGFDEEDRLTILSECCSDKFSEAEERKLLDLLRDKYAAYDAGWDPYGPYKEWD